MSRMKWEKVKGRKGNKMIDLRRALDSHYQVSIPFGILILFALYSFVLQTNGLQSNFGIVRWNGTNGLSGEIRGGGGEESSERYDPVEAYHQLRRYYLSSSTSSLAKDKERSGGGLGKKSSSSSSWYEQPNSQSPSHHTQIESQYHYNHQRNNGHHHLLQSHSNINSNINKGDEPGQRCFVCLPPNKQSREARDILAMFEAGDQAKIADCAGFTQHNSDQYEFPCPPSFGGCILRIHGPNISRACSKYRLNDCKKANSVEFCYCTQPLCNDVKQEPYLWNQQHQKTQTNGGGNGGRSNSRIDDEDLEEYEDSERGSGSSLPDKDSPSDSTGLLIVSNSNSNPDHVQNLSSSTSPTPTVFKENEEDENEADRSVPIANFNLDKDNVATSIVMINSGGGGSRCETSFSFLYSSLLSLCLSFYFTHLRIR